MRATASQVDVRSTATETNLSSDLLERMPIYSSTSTACEYRAGHQQQLRVRRAGHLRQRSAARRRRHPRSRRRIGLDVFNQNLIQEVQIGGLGATAEFGGFTGAVINTITKSGSEQRSPGLFSMRYTNDSLASDNIDDEILGENPTLGEAAITKKFTDYTVQIGGPIKRDKAFFFVNVQRYYAPTDPSGRSANSSESARDSTRS